MAPEKTRAIDVQDFVDLDEIDPIYFDSPYYLGPADGAEKAYSLLAAAMEASGKVAIARFVFRNKEHLAAIRTSGGVLTLTTMRFADEVVPAGELEEVLPDKAPKVAKKEQEMAEQLIESLSAEFDPSAYRDEYREQLLGADRTQGRRQGDRRLRGGGAEGDQGPRPDGGAGAEHRRGQGQGRRSRRKPPRRKRRRPKRRPKKRKRRKRRKARRRDPKPSPRSSPWPRARWSRSTGGS